jgi:hypothetical protein
LPTGYGPCAEAAQLTTHFWLACDQADCESATTMRMVPRILHVVRCIADPPSRNGTMADNENDSDVPVPAEAREQTGVSVPTNDSRGGGVHVLSFSAPSRAGMLPEDDAPSSAIRDGG